LSLLEFWIRNKKQLEDRQFRVGNVVFHIPYDRETRTYLNFKCQKCGHCCTVPRGLPLTFQDIRRLMIKLGYSSVDKFLSEECVYGVISMETVYPLNIPAKMLTWNLKRFKDETEDDLMIPHRCRFLKNGLCTIYDVRPMVCRKYPFYEFKAGGIVHAAYTSEEKSKCKGFFASRKFKPKLYVQFSKWLEQGWYEVVESLEYGLSHLIEPFVY